MADDRKQELIQELAQARSRFTVSRRALRDSVHVGDMVQSHLKRFRGIYMTCATLVGLLIAKLPARTKKVVVKAGSKGDQQMKAAGAAGLGLAAFKVVFDLAKPFLLSYLKKRLIGGGGSRRL